MKHAKRLALAFLLLFSLLTAACGSKSGIEGSWAYNHEPETPILTVKGNRAEYKGAQYDAAFDGSFLTLTADGESLRLRCEFNKEGVLLYEPADYVRDASVPGEGLVGLWSDEADKWSFEFTAGGTFKEDGYFPGLYTADEEAGTVKLIYNDMFPDTTLYYVLDGDTLHVEYPWQLVSAE